MSKLAAAINSTLTGDVRAARELDFNFTSVKLACTNTPLARGLKLMVKFETTVWVDEIYEPQSFGTQSFGNQHEIERQAVFDAKRAMIEEVFGEFRPLILEARLALHQGDKYKVRALLAELENQMFVDGV